MTSPSEETILVTGANGFVAGHIIKAALEKGYRVRGTVRSESSSAKIRSTFPQHASQLSFAIVPDITKHESYKDAMDGVTSVIHTASPFVLAPKDNVTELLDPAIHGAVAILEAVQRYGPSVRRVVNTSSFAAIVDLGRGSRPGYTYTEVDWNPVSYEEAAEADGVTAYCASKTLAEQAAWDWMDANMPAFSLTALCPPWVFGPHVGGLRDTAHLNESTQVLFGLFGAEKVPPTDFAGFTDVRDLATAHVAALEQPEAAGRRFLVGSHFDYQSAVDVVREEIPELRSRIPEGKPGAGKTEEVYAVDGSKALKVLGITYTPLGVTMRDSFSELVAAGA